MIRVSAIIEKGLSCPTLRVKQCDVKVNPLPPRTAFWVDEHIRH